MASVFWDEKGLILFDFLEQGKTVNANHYIETLKKLSGHLIYPLKGDLQEPRDHRHRSDIYWMQKIWETPFVGGFLNIVHDIYPHLVSTDLLRQSFSQVQQNLAESPCSTLLYMFLVLFGFLPFICFFLFVCGTCILWLVCFIFCQAMAVVFAGAVFGGMFFFIIVASCIMATALGMTVHTLSLLGQVYRVLAFNAPETVAFLRQQLARLGIHLRLPEDDQA